MSLSQALGTAVAGLRTTQTGLALVSANVANAQTPGYVKKTLNQEASTASGAGVSVRVSGIKRELDQYIQRQLRAETSGGTYAELRSQFYQRLQQVYGDPGSASSLETTYSDFTTALQALATSPEDFSARANVLGAAQVLAQQLNGLTTDIQGLRSDAEQGLSDAVRSANNALTRIAQINQELATAHTTDAAAATLLDQRDQYIDQLSQLMDIKVIQGDANQVNIFTSSGIQLVGTQASRLAFDAHGTVTPNAVWDADPAKRGVGTLTLVSGGNGGTVDLIATKAIRSGQIAAYLEMRDHVLVEAQHQLDQLAGTLAQSLSDHTTDGTVVLGPPAGFDVDVNGLLAGNTINFTYTDTATNTPHKVTIVRVDDPAALPLSDTLTADPNDQVVGVDWSGGLTSVLTQLNAKFNGKPQFSNPSGTMLRIVDDGPANVIDVTAASITKTVTSLTSGLPELPFFLDANSPFSGATTGIGPQVVGLAGRINVNGALLADPSRLVVYQTAPLTPSGDTTRPNFIYDRLNSTLLSFSPSTGIGTADAPFTGTLPAYLRQVMSQQGSNAEAAKNLSDGQDMVVNALKQRFNDDASVNVDEEMAKLLTLQTAYGANARIISVVKELFDALMRI